MIENGKCPPFKEGVIIGSFEWQRIVMVCRVNGRVEDRRTALMGLKKVATCTYLRCNGFLAGGRQIEAALMDI